MFTVKIHQVKLAIAISDQPLLEQDELGKMKEELVVDNNSTRSVCSESDVGESPATSTLSFASGNPRVETTHGVMHLFRNVSASPPSAGFLPTGRNENLCILAIPNHMSVADFCQFMGSFLQNVNEMRLVRDDASSDRYSALIKFDNQNSADNFFKHYNGKPFSSLEEEACHVLFIADVQYTNYGEEACSPPVGLTELPTCPVCLERLDHHISGILTTVCNSSFHNSCILKWKDSSCPVCRYCEAQSTETTCTICSTSKNLWICVICGFVGCGRYQEGHAIKHWKETQHCYSLEVETQRVWDYVGDGYVHRLIQSKSDGKLVELNAPCSDASAECDSCECSHGSELSEALMDSKIDAIMTEYNELLTSQLEKQRQYFEGLLLEKKHEKDVAVSQAVEKAVNNKLQKLQSKLDKIEKEKTFLEEVNESMKTNQESWKSAIIEAETRERSAIKERDEKIAELQEQVRDLMVYIEAQKTVETSQFSDLKDGTVLRLHAPSTPKQSSRSTRTTGRKKR